MNHFRRDSARAILERAGPFPTDVDGHGALCLYITRFTLLISKILNLLKIHQNQIPVAFATN